MKRFILIYLLALGCLTMQAQYREVTLPEKPQQKGYKNYLSQDKGFWFAFEAEGASSVMESKDNLQVAGLTFTGGYRLNEYLRVGLGFGGRYYVNHAEVRGSSSKLAMPFFVNARGNIISAYDRDGVPFWSVNVGAVTKEGFYLNPTVGYSFGGLRNNFLLGLSYTLSSFTRYEPSQTYSYLGIKLGYEF